MKHLQYATKQAKEIRRRLYIDISKELREYHEQTHNSLITGIVLQDVRTRLKLSYSSYAIIMLIYLVKSKHDRATKWIQIQTVTPFIKDRQRRTCIYKLIKDGYADKYTDTPEGETWRLTKKGRKLIGQIKRLSKNLYYKHQQSINSKVSTALLFLFLQWTYL